MIRRQTHVPALNEHQVTLCCTGVFQRYRGPDPRTSVSLITSFVLMISSSGDIWTRCPPECLIACGWWLNTRHKRGRRNVNQAADAWNQYYTLITCHEWPLRDTPKCWVCSWQWRSTDPAAYISDSSWSWPPTIHTQSWNSLSSGQQLWLCEDVRPSMTGGNLREVLSASVTWKPLSQHNAPPHVELEVQGDEVAIGELNQLKPACNCF